MGPEIIHAKRQAAKRQAAREEVVTAHHRKLRDVFATAALTGLARLNWNPEDIARRCYQYADAMLAERRRRQQ